jgi:hypothetical protein
MEEPVSRLLRLRLLWFVVEAAFQLDLQLEPEAPQPLQEVHSRVTSFRFVAGNSADYNGTL